MIKKHDPSKEYYFDEGCFITETSNSEDDEAVSIARARVKSGVRTKWHHLEGTWERYVILQGSGLVEVGTEAAQAVSIGDVVLVPANVRQRIKNTGETDLVFLAICSPRFQKKNYREGSV